MFDPQYVLNLIVSNPPYVSAHDYAALDEEIRLYEPKLALIADKKGQEFYKRIIHRAKHHLNENGKVYLEISETLTQSVSRIASSNGFRRIEVKQDLAGRDRYICIQ